MTRMRIDSDCPIKELTCCVKHMTERGTGYKIRVNGEWYEVSAVPCEPPDTYGDIVRSDMY